MQARKTDGTTPGPRESATIPLAVDGSAVPQTAIRPSPTSDTFHLTRALRHLADVAPAVGQSASRNLPGPTTIPPSIPESHRRIPASVVNRKRRHDEEVREDDVGVDAYVHPGPRSTDARPAISPIATGSYHDLPRVYAPPALDTTGYSQFYSSYPYPQVPYPGYPTWMPAVTVSYPSPRFTPRHATVPHSGRYPDAGFTYQTVSSLYGVPISPMESPQPGVSSFFRQDAPPHPSAFAYPPYASHPSVFSHMPLNSPGAYADDGWVPMQLPEDATQAPNHVLADATSAFDPLTVESEADARYINPDELQPEPKAYRCRKCGEFKKGHTCRILHRTPPPDPDPAPSPTLSSP